MHVADVLRLFLQRSIEPAPNEYGMEEEKNYLNRVEETVGDATRYFQVQRDRLKLRLLDNFSTLFNTIFGVLVLMILISCAAMFLAVALTWAIGLWIGSMFWALMIMAGLFLIAAGLVYIYRKQLIMGPVIRMLSKIMFEKEADDE